MSKWTHVVGAVRYDGFDNLTLFDLTELLGKVTHKFFGDDVVIHESEVVPNGSEGCLTYKIIYNDEKSSIHYADVVISGDLRDYDVTMWSEIEEWFGRITSPDKASGIWVRQGVMLIEDDYFGKEQGERKLLTFNDKGEE